MSKTDPVPEAVRILAEHLGQPRPMRRGSLGERLTRCGKPGCACARDEAARHGPYFSLTRSRTSGTESRRLSAEQAARAREQLAAGRAFREAVEAYWQTCERWADAELDDVAAAAGQTAAEKGGSRRSSTPTSSRRSRRS